MEDISHQSESTQPGLQTDSSAPTVVYSDYHTEVFYDLIPRYRMQIKEALHEVPRALRKEHFLPRLPSVGWMSGECAWSVCSDYLKVIEHEMAKILSQHSVFFWLHLYRRIGVTLSSDRNEKIDAVTIGLVRQIAELAIIKFGSLSRNDDLNISTKSKFSEVLGGNYRRVMQKLHRRRDEGIIPFLALRASPQWVVTDFSVRDLIAVFANEGLAYEYWRITALMRAIGKGSKISRSEDDWIDYFPNPELSALIESYDARLGKHSGSTLAGTWFGTRCLDKDSPGSWMLLPYYNINGLGAEDGISLPGASLPPKHLFRPNFLLHSMDTVIFRNANVVLSEPFHKRRGYKIETLMTALWGIANAVLFPSQTIFRDPKKRPDSWAAREPLISNLLHMMQRGYGVFPSDGGLVAEILTRAAVFEAPFGPFDEHEITNCVLDLSLTADKQCDISLWSGGPRYPIIPYGRRCIVLDLAGMAPILRTLFVRIRHDGSKRGIAFEEEFRSALASAGFPIEYCGILEARDGQKREIDASVKLGSRLYIFECVSIERPLDFDIGKISTISHRNSELDAKLDQVTTLKEFILAKPQGCNYDFQWADDLQVFVVSPFVEWVWSLSSRLWDGSRPRVISAEEAIEYLRADAAMLRESSVV